MQTVGLGTRLILLLTCEVSSRAGSVLLPAQSHFVKSVSFNFLDVSTFSTSRDVHILKIIVLMHKYIVTQCQKSSSMLICIAKIRVKDYKEQNLVSCQYPILWWFPYPTVYGKHSKCRGVGWYFYIHANRSPCALGRN